MGKVKHRRNRDWIAYPDNHQAYGQVSAEPKAHSCRNNGLAGQGDKGTENPNKNS